MNCGKAFRTSTEVKVHSIVHSEVKPFVCDFKGCEFRAKRQRIVDNHKLVHTNVLPFKCEECHNCFKTKYMLSAHQKRMHSSCPSFLCRFEGCRQLFQTDRQLFRHKVKVHNVKRKIYRCDWPGCDYTSIKSLTEHKALHTGDRLRLCSWPGCDKTFRTWNILRTHLLIHKNEKRFVCDWPGCEYRAITNTMVTQHKKWNHKQ